MRRRQICRTSLSCASANSGLTMHVVSVDFGYPINRNSISLLDGKRMVGGLKFDVGPDTVVSEMHTCLEIFGARIERQFGGEPAKEWSDVRSLRLVETSYEVSKSVLAERDPNAPGERFRFSVNGDLERTAFGRPHRCRIPKCTCCLDPWWGLSRNKAAPRRQKSASLRATRCRTYI